MRERESERTYASERDVKIAAFDVIERIKDRRAVQGTEMRWDRPLAGEHYRQRATQSQSEADRIRHETEQRLGLRLVNGSPNPCD